MADINIKFACRCGFIGHLKVDTKNTHPADDTIEQLTPIIQHVERTGHTIRSIVGTISSSK